MRLLKVYSSRSGLVVHYKVGDGEVTVRIGASEKPVCLTCLTDSCSHVSQVLAELKPRLVREVA
jgi:hypothetical protein